MLITSVSQRVEDFVGKCSFLVVSFYQFYKGMWIYLPVTIFVCVKVFFFVQ